MAKGNICKVTVYSEVLNADLEVACFIIKSINYQVNKNGSEIRLSGPDLMTELNITINKVISDETTYTSTTGSLTSAFVATPSLTVGAWEGYSIRTDDDQHYGVVDSNNTSLITLLDEWTNGEPGWPDDIILFGVDPDTSDVTNLMAEAAGRLVHFI